MNSKMWANPIVQQNITILTEQLKFKTIGPAAGRLACGTTGIGTHGRTRRHHRRRHRPDLTS